MNTFSPQKRTSQDKASLIFDPNFVIIKRVPLYRPILGFILHTNMIGIFFLRVNSCWENPLKFNEFKIDKSFDLSLSPHHSPFRN